MEARHGQKIKLLYLIEILAHETDEEHPLSAEAIVELLAKKGVSAERKAIYSDIETLTAYGYDIVSARAPKRGYFLGGRTFETPEIYLLADAVRAAKFISAKKTRELVGKLDGMLSVYQAQNREKCYIDDGGKCANETLYYVIDTVNEAIRQQKKITFRYAVRTLSPARGIVSESRERKVSPYALTWQDDHYYLVGNYEQYNNTVNLRVDRMRGVELTGEAARPFREVSEYTDVFDIADYTRKRFSMYGGEPEEIALRCSSAILEPVLDRFSERIFPYDVTDTAFSFSVKAVPSDALVTWLLHYGSGIEVLSPQTLRDRVSERAAAVLAVYRGEK